MLNVPNKRCIRRLSDRSLKAAKTRNIIAVIAIALTTVLFTSLFTIAMSINDSFQQGNFRQAGGDNHGTFKDLTEAQVAELRDDPLIQESGTRLMVGMTSDDPPFNKSHIEVSYMDPTQAKHYFIEPVEGRLPAEGTDEAAADTRVLSLLGVEPKIGARFTLPIAIDGNTEDAHVVERTFTLCGWWEYDSAITASHVLLPRSAADELCALSTGSPYTATGTWSLDVMLASSLHIREDLTQILANHGYQCENAGEEDYIGIGVNWGYSGAQLAAQADPMTVIAIAAMLIDHIGGAFFPEVGVFRWIGRLAFPIFCYCLTVGLLYTHDVRKYLTRLGIFALVSQPFYILAFHPVGEFWANLTNWNIFFTLFLSLLGMYGLKERKWWLFALALFTVSWWNFDYSGTGIQLMLIFYLCRNRPRLGAALYLLSYLPALMNGWPEDPLCLTVGGLCIDWSIFAVFAAPLIFCATHSRIKINRWFFYAFYPAHLAAIALAGNIL